MKISRNKTFSWSSFPDPGLHTKIANTQTCTEYRLCYKSFIRIEDSDIFELLILVALNVMSNNVMYVDNTFIIIVIIINTFNSLQ